MDDSYCGACDVGNPTLCDPGTVPVCRETAYGLTAVVDIHVENMATLCSGLDLPDCENLFQQMIDQIIAQTPGLAPANVIVSNAGCV
jgi:hypothetical protein